MKIVECPRDAIQGKLELVSTERKINYYQKLLAIGFYALDCGSFVSEKLIPQMTDTLDVLDALDVSETKTKLSVIVINNHGIDKALHHPKIDILGFPFSISETFQQYNTHKSRLEAFELIKTIKPQIITAKKELLVYFSMAFGNPYGDVWNIDEVLYWTEKMFSIGIMQINFADTVALAQPEVIQNIFHTLKKEFPTIEFSAHFHTEKEDWYKKVNAAYLGGCRKFDSTIKGYGGCPMSKSKMIGNVSTEKLINFMALNKIASKLDLLAFETAYNSALDIF